MTKILAMMALAGAGCFSGVAISGELPLVEPLPAGGMIAILLCLGFLLACTLYCAYVALDSGERSYLYYVICSVSLIWLWCELGGFISPLASIPYLGAFVFITANTLFVERFLFIQRHCPGLSTWFKAGAVLPVAALLPVWILPQYSGFFIAALLSVLVLTTFIGAVQSFKGGLKSAVLCVLANIVLYIALIVAWQMAEQGSPRLSDSQIITLVSGTIVYVIFSAFALVGKFIAIARRNIESSEDLEQKVLQRTEQLQGANENLEQLAVGLKQADAAKSTFLVNMSHEMRTPLTAIIGYADGIAQGEIVDDEKAKAMAVIRNNGQHLLDIITDLLDISKIESDTLEIEKQPFDPLAMVHHISHLVTTEVERKQLKFSVIYRLPLPTQMVSDAKRVRQILLNIVNNAIKFTHRGEVELMMSSKDGLLTFSVADTGIGMNENQLEKLFQAFSQEDLTKSRQYGGAGLGLNIAKSLADKLGATIEVSSTQGQGSTFTVVLPQQTPDEARWLHRQDELDNWLGNVDSEQDKVQKVDVPKLSGKILLAEDHPDNQKLFIRMLQHMGLKVTAVDNGFKAVQATLEEDFDIILMDIQMPEMDGLKAFELIQGTCSDVPVIALTANAMKSDVELYMSKGFKDHIAKPVDRQIFIDTILKYLGVNEPVEISLELDELDEIKQQFVVRLVKRMDDIKKAHDIEDWDDIGKHAHAIKGSAGMFGFDELGALGAELELSVKNGDMANCRTQLQDLLQVCENITAGVS